MYKENKWAQAIIKDQNADGSWHIFHTLSEPSKLPTTTEQALRRLEVLGYDLNDEPIKKAVDYTIQCLKKEKDIPDYKEKHHLWENFADLMLATWVRRFTRENKEANDIANQWQQVTIATFKSGQYSIEDFKAAFQAVFSLNATKKIAYQMKRFYNVSLCVDLLDSETEEKFFDYILSSDEGIYYVYTKPLMALPTTFQSKATSKYLAAIDLLADYKNQKHKLMFVVKWLYSHQNDDGTWDMGPKIKDGIYYPLSDDWRKKENRVADCTFRIRSLIEKIEG